MLHKNLALIGPPGSGKGSYGRYLASALNLSVITVSDVLRQFRPDVDLSSGDLVSDEVVSDALLECLHDHHTEQTGYILDGFPRTLEQAQVMEWTWPVDYQLQAAIKLAVPDTVCETKLMGRRFCTKCDSNFNVSGVDWERWNLPPLLPTPETNDPSCSANHCGEYWQTRPDDRQDVVRQRLQTYHGHMDPIMDYFEQQNRLLKLEPYNGFDDVPDMIAGVKQWLDSLQDHGPVEP